MAFPSAMLGIYFVLAIMFGSLLQPLLVMSVIPFVGVVVSNSLVLINCINELKLQGYTSSEAVLNASLSRLRPILLTSITTVAGLLPLTYGLGGTDVYMESLTLGYGLLFSLPVVLIVIPYLYLTVIPS